MMKGIRGRFFTAAAACLMGLTGLSVFLLPPVRVTDACYLMAAMLLVCAFGLPVWPWKDKLRGMRTGEIVLCTALSLLFLAQLTVFSLPEAELWPGDGPVLRWVFRVWLSLLTGAAAFLFLALTLQGMACTEDAPEGVRRAKRMAFALIAAVSVMFLLSTYPGWNYPDIQSAWSQGAYGDWNEWHTLGFLYLIHLCSLVFPEPFSVMVFQTVLWLAVNWAALDILSEKGSVRVLRLFAAGTVLMLTPFIYLQDMIKDTVFGICLYGTCLGLYQVVHRQHLRWTDWLLLTFCALGTALFRHAGVVVAAAALLIACIVRLCLHLRETGKPLATLAFVVAAYYLLVPYLGRQVLWAESNPPYIKYTVPFYMAGELVADDQVELEEEDLAFLEELAEIDDWKAMHQKYFADPVAREYGILGDIGFMDEDEYGPQIMALNLHAFLRYPGRYLTHFSHITSILWQMARPADGYEWGPIEGMAADYAVAIEGVTENGLTRVTREVANLSGKLPAVRSVIWRGGFVQFADFALICFLFARKRRREVVALVPVVLYQASLYLSIPAQDPRYVLPMLEVFPFFVCAVLPVLGQGRKRDGAEEREASR